MRRRNEAAGAQSNGGAKSATSQPEGENMDSRKSCCELAAAKRLAVAEGVASRRAHKPRRFGTTMRTRPPGASTRHIWRSIPRRDSLASSP